LAVEIVIKPEAVVHGHKGEEVEPLERLTGREREQIVRPLLDHLARGEDQPDGRWQDWQIRRIGGGRNNLLYRATGPQGDLVCKFTVLDGKDRTGREYGALVALREAGLRIAPAPILQDRSSYAQPVVVQTWLEGEVSAAPPATEAEWLKLLQHLALVHRVRPEGTAVYLRWATINACTVKEGRERVREQAARLPAEVRPTPLQALLRRFEAFGFAEWLSAPVRLCRLDNNVTNYIRRPGLWASVDWEYSGWGDPAFDVANLITHVAYLEVPASRWGWIAEAYQGLVEDATASQRIGVYCQILVVWWVARLTRYLYEIPRGLDQRLVDWPVGWEADIEAKYEHYLHLAEEMGL
jgi:aminoglycoside phosphotransferase (APT) family kinase protein